jgi:SAM-dependent methyltransferase
MDLNFQKDKSTPAYNSKEFINRVNELKRVKLKNLYPSEAWSLYRILPECRDVLDLGCGGGDMAEIVNTISKTTQYIGLDGNKDLIEIAKKSGFTGNPRFISEDVFKYLEGKEAFECVMGWAFLYAVLDPYKLLELMVKKASKYVLFDIRSAVMQKDVLDMSLSHVVYGENKGPLPIVSFRNFINAIRGYEEQLEEIEMTGYYFPFGSHVVIDKNIPEPAIISVILKKASINSKSSKKSANWHMNLPKEFQEELS